MSISYALYNFLKGQSAVSTLVGTRIYPLRAPQSPTYPFITYNQSAEVRTHTMDAKATTNAAMQIHCWAKSYSGAVALADAVTSVLDCYVGTMASNEKIGAALQQGRIDFVDDEIEEEDYRVILNYAIQHSPV